jgi:hypothetical protein
VNGLSLFMVIQAFIQRVHPLYNLRIVNPEDDYVMFLRNVG